MTLRAPYSPHPNSADSPSSFFSAGGQRQQGDHAQQDQVPGQSSDVGTPTTETQQQSSTSTTPTQLHHVPHPFSHHSHTHSHSHQSRTHRGRGHPSEPGGLYAPFDLPIPVDLTLEGLPSGLDLGTTMSGIDMMALQTVGGNSGPTAPPGEVRVGVGLTATARADLQRRTDEILAFSARSMPREGTDESGR